MREKIACIKCPHERDCDSAPTLGGKPKSGACKEALATADRVLALLHEGIEKLRHNPTQYHYVCWASGIVKVRDEWGSKETHQCRAFNGDFNCGYRGCKTGVIEGQKELTDWERAENEMLQKVLALLEKGQ